MMISSNYLFFFLSVPKSISSSTTDTTLNMDAESHNDHHYQQQPNSFPMSKGLKLTLAVLSCSLLTFGTTGGPFLLRLYFRKGGKRQWFSSFLQSAGWPVIFIPLVVSYVHRRSHHGPGQPPAKLFFLTPRLFAACAVLGLLTGLDNFLYAYGLAFLPVSTSALLISTQLAFTAFFAFLVVRPKFTAYSISSVALLTVGAVVLGLHANSDRPDGVTKDQYAKGFFLTLMAAASYGLVLPLIELMYGEAKQAITYTLVMEMQLVMGFFAMAFCIMGMAVNKDFQAIPKEARTYELGRVRYYTVILGLAIFWQFFFLGAVGVIFTVHTLFTGIIIAACIPITETLGVILFHEKFSIEKGLALILSLVGLASYSYGEYKEQKKHRPLQQEDLSHGLL